MSMSRIIRKATVAILLALLLFSMNIASYATTDIVETVDANILCRDYEGCRDSAAARIQTEIDAR